MKLRDVDGFRNVWQCFVLVYLAVARERLSVKVWLKCVVLCDIYGAFLTTVPPLNGSTVREFEYAHVYGSAMSPENFGHFFRVLHARADNAFK